MVECGAKRQYLATLVGKRHHQQQQNNIIVYTSNSFHFFDHKTSDPHPLSIFHSHLKFVVNLYVMGTGIFRGWCEMDNHYYIDSFWLFQIGGLIGTILFGFIAMKFGRKISLQYSFIFISVSAGLKCWTFNFNFQSKEMF